jgi:hypothetical protein
VPPANAMARELGMQLESGRPTPMAGLRASTKEV